MRLEAGRPVAFLNEKNVKKLSLHIGDRVEIKQNGSKAIATLDIGGIVNDKEVAFSKEVSTYIAINQNLPVEVNLAVEPASTAFIAKKLAGKTLSKEEIFSIIKDIVTNSLTEAEIAYFVSGVYEKGMSFQETVYLTDAIYRTGTSLSWNSKEIADKHSIGGIAGNRTTPIVVSICASAGIIMPKTSSRAITSAAGTADVIEVLAKVDFSAKDLKEIVKKTGACLAWGGSLGLAPADDKLIRVEKLLKIDPESQLIASIISKKLAAGSKYVLIDIPYGPQAKVSKEEANKLKDKFLKIAKAFGLKMHVLLTVGDQPIGNGIGPVLEMIDVLKVLKRDNPPEDLEDKAIFLASKILEMMSKAKSGKGESMARNILESGKALKKFEEILSAQGKTNSGLSLGKYKHELFAKKSGKVASIDNKWVNTIGRTIGCPEDKKAGLYLHKHKGENVVKGEKIITLYAESKQKMQEAINFYNSVHVVNII